MRYLRRPDCPACGGSGDAAGDLEGGAYRFGRVEVAHPEDGVRLLRCRDCTLVWKEAMVAPADLAALLATEAAEVWRTHGYTYPTEIATARRYLDRSDSVDVLDVGSGDGGMLRAWGATPGRRSALDVVRIPACLASVRGEFIDGFIEDDLRWSGVPYDVVSVFDVLEHLYDPRLAFANLAQLTRPGGIVFAQTGDAATARRLGSWWYANLFEHHVLWTREALARAADAAGFDVVSAETTVHKNRPYMGVRRRAALAVARAARAVPGARRVLLRTTGRDIRLLGPARTKDHLTVILRRR